MEQQAMENPDSDSMAEMLDSHSNRINFIDSDSTKKKKNAT